MIQQDYILRMIEQLGQMLRALFAGERRGLREVQNFDADRADEVLEKSSQEALGLSFQTIKGMKPDEVATLFRSGGATWINRCFFVGRLFEFDADIAERAGETDREKNSAERALYFYNLLRGNPEVPQEYLIEERFTRVTERLKANAPLPFPKGED